MKAKKLRIVGVFLLIVIAFSFVTITSADGIRKRVKFGKGRSAATLSGAVIRGDVDTYIVGASRGQTMRVSITSLEKNAVFQIKTPGGDFWPGAAEPNDATRGM